MRCQDQARGLDLMKMKNAARVLVPGPGSWSYLRYVRSTLYLFTHSHSKPNKAYILSFSYCCLPCSLALAREASAAVLRPKGLVGFGTGHPPGCLHQ
jgi:hypothetical protein